MSGGAKKSQTFPSPFPLWGRHVSHVLLFREGKMDSRGYEDPMEMTQGALWAGSKDSYLVTAGADAKVPMAMS